MLCGNIQFGGDGQSFAITAFGFHVAAQGKCYITQTKIGQGFKIAFALSLRDSLRLLIHIASLHMLAVLQEVCPQRVHGISLIYTYANGAKERKGPLVATACLDSVLPLPQNVALRIQSPTLSTAYTLLPKASNGFIAHLLSQFQFALAG